MLPELFEIPGLGWPIRSYGFMIVIGFLLSTWLASRECRRRGLPDVVYDLGVWMLITGLIGGRLFYYIEFYQTQFADRSFWALFKIWEGGLVFYGGAIGGSIGGLFFLLRKRLPIPDLLDAIAAFCPIAMAFGRLGCFLNGCCWGGVCAADFPLAASYPRGSGEVASGALEQHIREGLVPPDALHSLPVYPIQVYESVIDLVLFALLYWYLRGPSPRGGGMPLLFLLYAIARFNLEFLRADNDEFFLGMTISQTVSLGTFAFFLPLFIKAWRTDIRIPLRDLPRLAEA